jgi:putative transposase
MKANMGRRYRLYPALRQAERLTNWAHTSRAVWNVALAQRQFAWTQRGVTLRAVGQTRALSEARAELPWLADLPAQAAQQVLRTLRFRLSRPFGGEIRNATVSRDALGWHVSFGVATHERPAVANGLPGCGVDFGVACSAFVSDESTPRRMSSTLSAGEWRRLLSLERRKARQLRWAKRHNAGRYSKRLRRSINEIAKLRARQARRRADFTHKFTTDVAKRHGWVGIEDLRVVAMTASAGGNVEVPGRNVHQKATLNRAILDNAPGERRRQLAYKTRRFGSELRLVAPAGTSQTCAACGHRDPASRPGCGRVFACTDCGYQAHADANAARNIEALAA